MAQKILFIVGPHRSGTSAVTQAFHKAGFEVGDTLLPSNDGNPSGYWEDEIYVACNDEILAEAGRHWRDPRPIEADSLNETTSLLANRRMIAKRLAKQLKQYGKLVVKDPRLCRTLPIWLEALNDLSLAGRKMEAGFVFVGRNADTTIQSLVRRDGESADRSALLWLAYSFEAARHLKNQNTALLKYEDFVKAPFKTVERALHTLGWADDAKAAMKVRPGVDAVVDAERAKSSGREESAMSEPMRSLVKQVESALDVKDMAALDLSDYQTQVEQAYALFAPFIDAEITRTQRRSSDFDALEEQAKTLAHQLKVAKLRLKLKETQSKLKADA